MQTPTTEQQYKTLKDLLSQELTTIIIAFKADADYRYSPWLPWTWSLKRYAGELPKSFNGPYPIDNLIHWLTSDAAKTRHGQDFLKLLVRRVLQNADLYQALNISVLNNARYDQHAKLLIEHKYPVTSTMPKCQLEQKSHSAFVLDYLQEALHVWQQVNQTYLTNNPYFKCFAGIPSDVWRSYIVKPYINDPGDLKNLAIVANEVRFKQKETELAGQYATFFRVVKNKYYEELHPLAEKLKQHLYYYRYEEAKALIEKHLLVLTIKTEYYPNRWAEKNNVRSLGELSAVEYVWRMGDANFIELFDQYRDKLPSECLARREEQESGWETQSALLAAGFNTYSEDADWEKFKNSFNACPTWVHLLAWHLYYNRPTEAGSLAVNVVTPAIRSVRRGGCAPPLNGLAVCSAYVATYLSLSHTPGAASKLPEQSIVVNEANHSPEQQFTP